MKQVYHLNIQFGKMITDLYFEDKELAEKLADALFITCDRRQVQITATVEKVYTKEMITEDILTAVQWVEMTENSKRAVN